MDVVGRELYPKAFHGPTWSLRADAPSRDRAPERPRLSWPPWFFDLASGSEERASQAVQVLDDLPIVSKSELRWVQIILAVADRLGVLYGRSCCAEAAALEVPRPCRHPQGPSGGDDGGAEGAAGGAARRVHLGANPDGNTGDLGDGKFAAALERDPRIWFQVIRDAAAGGGSPRGSLGGAGQVRIRSTRTGRQLAGNPDLGKVGTQRGPDALSALGASCLQGRGIGLELAADCAAVTSGLFLLVEAGGALRSAARRYFDEHYDGGRGVVVAHREGQVVVSKGARAVRETRRAAQLRVLRAFREAHAPFGALVASFERSLHVAAALTRERRDRASGAIHDGEPPDGRRDVPF